MSAPSPAADRQWVARPRDYEDERKSSALPSVPAPTNPLVMLIHKDASASSSAAVASSSATNAASKANPLTANPLTANPLTANPLSANPLSANPLMANPLSANPLSANPLMANPLMDNPLMTSAISSRSSASIAASPLSTTDSLTYTSSKVLGLAAQIQPVSQDSIEAEILDTFVPWALKKPGILTKYSTTENIPVTANFLASEDLPSQVKVPVDRVKSRLEQLEEEEKTTTGSSEITQLSQKDYVIHIESLNDDLRTAWANEERVKSLKLVIQAAKLLCDTTVIRFYPSKFVLVTEILDTFGKLVYDRLFKKGSDNEKIPLPEKFSAKLVSESAKETCRNWFFKIASIRELIPRLFVEMAIIRCYNFLADNEFPKALNRLSTMIRGIGDPLVSLYARAYLARKGFEVAPHIKDYLMTCFLDFLVTQKQLGTPHFNSKLDSIKLTVPEFVDLYTPGLEWLLQCLGFKATEELFKKIIQLYEQNASNSLILNCILSSFPPQYIAEIAVQITGMIRESDPTFCAKHLMYKSMGVILVMHPPKSDYILDVLNEVWKFVGQIQEPKDYIALADVYIEYAINHCTTKELNKLLGDLLKHVQPNNMFEQLQPQLQSIVYKIVSHYKEFSTIITMNKFLPLMDLFVGDAKVEVYKNVLDSFGRSSETTSDPQLINAIFDLCKSLHDDINSLSFLDEVRQVSRLINNFIAKVDYGKDVEQQLNFYVECRSRFANLDAVKDTLVHAVSNLAMRTLGLVNGRHSKKTAAFVRACVAYCFITIPSIDNIFMRLKLYLLVGQVAMMNQSLPQADAMFKTAINLIAEVPPTIEIDKQARATEDMLVEYLSHFMAALVTIPGHPEHGPLYLVQGLLQAIQDYNWEKGSDAKVRCYTNAVLLFSTYLQQSLPYHAMKVESNDTLFTGDPQYAEELNSLIDQYIGLILTGISELAEDEASASAKKKQAQRSLDLFARLLGHAELTTRSATLALKLYTVAKKSGGADAAALK
eukprot:TRINITY_DN2382_c0_g1_i2.p1 TRINITY_DN2382_c0_g1~~TRINITY_DN2382_c0_g1_i2.p1  ORF type:complete len:995 (-),score=236.10 TRINITY_DN2382_c0_g1_i2:586-3570(-)